MREYFKTKIGKTITKDIITGDIDYTGVYKRKYKIEVLSVKRNDLSVIVSSYDITPSGFIEGGSEKQTNEFKINLKKFENYDSIIKEILCRSDFAFFVRYPGSLK